jgi:hypothetical protein
MAKLVRIISMNRQPKLNEFGPTDLILNTTSGEIFSKANNQLIKFIAKNESPSVSVLDTLPANTRIGSPQARGFTNDPILNSPTLRTLSDVRETNEGAVSKGHQLTDSFYSIITSTPLTGSNVSLHGGITIDYGQPLPNSPYIKTNGGFDILMDNVGAYNNSSFRIFKDTGVAGVGGTELLKLDNNGNLTVSGSIITSGSGGNVSGSLIISGNLTVSGTSALNGDITIPKSVKLYFADVSGMHIYSEGTSTDENQIILAKTNNLKILNQAHGKDIIFGTENASGTAKTPLTLSSSGDATFGSNLTVTSNISASGTIVGSTLTGTIDGGSF